jgi:hypothetical protein
MRRADRDFRYHPEASKNFLMESPAVAAHPLRLPSSLFLSLEVRGEKRRNQRSDPGDCRFRQSRYVDWPLFPFADDIHHLANGKTSRARRIQALMLMLLEEQS